MSYEKSLSVSAVCRQSQGHHDGKNQFLDKKYL
jgi:hypothetical protein